VRLRAVWLIFAGQAGRADAASFASEGHQVLLAARLAFEAGEAAAEQAAVEVALELTPHERWQRRSPKARDHGRVERLHVALHHRVERRRLRAMPLVAAATFQRTCGEPHPRRS
jgi:hypothetical protein